MAYSKFTFELIEEQFGITNQIAKLFVNPKGIEPSDWLKSTLEMAHELPVRSEKSKSEAIVFPILMELRKLNNNYFTIYSGENLEADKSKGLTGECDFILSKDTGSFSITYPVLQLIEAKKHDIELGVPQCAAQMIGARVFNEKKGIKLDKIYGCVTNGNEWLFMVLEDKIYVDSQPYFFNDVSKLLGVFQVIIDYYKEVLKK